MIGLRAAVTHLRRHYGPAPPVVSRDPFQLILWEPVAYLVPDAQRRRAFTLLRHQVGLRPAAILGAKPSLLLRITRVGGSIAAASRAARLQRSAEIVIDRWQGDLRRALRLPLAAARRALAQFPMIGEPGADKILLVTGTARLLALDSNALRVLQRLKLARPAKDYRTTYRRAQASLAPVLPHDRSWLLAVSGLLRRHGQELCRRRSPLCSQCPLRSRCPSAFTRG